MPDVTPKTESAARDELIEWNRRNLHAEEPYFTDLIDRACSEAASAAVAEALDGRDALIADLDTFIKYTEHPSMGRDTPAMLEEVGRVMARHAKELRAALIASERGT